MLYHVKFINGPIYQHPQSQKMFGKTTLGWCLTINKHVRPHLHPAQKSYSFGILDIYIYIYIYIVCLFDAFNTFQYVLFFDG